MTYSDDAPKRYVEYEKAFRVDLEKRTTDTGFLWMAKDYYKAAQDIKEKYPGATKMFSVKFYLLCHSLELVFKSFLRNRGYSVKDLRTHDLVKLIIELHDKHGILLDKDDIEQIELANYYYATKQYEYPFTGSKFVPNIERLSAITHLMISKVNHDLYKLS
jgi:hypothetical protein